MPVAQIVKENFFEQLTKAVYLDYVLKFAGVAVFALTYLNAWHAMSTLTKLGFAGSAAAWAVGARLYKLYRA